MKCIAEGGGAKIVQPPHNVDSKNMDLPGNDRTDSETRQQISVIQQTSNKI